MLSAKKMTIQHRRQLAGSVQAVLGKAAARRGDILGQLRALLGASIAHGSSMGGA